jgi:hypothetical protein
MAGGLVLALIFLTVLLNGHWPDFLRPVQLMFQTISSVFGSFALVLEVWIFIGPGAVIYLVGQKLAERRSQRK